MGGSCIDHADKTVPLKERIRKSKRLCFVIPLSPSRSALSIFNSTDLSFTLTTSVEKLAADLDRIQRSSTSRSALIKDRVRTSKQVEWLKKSKTGTNVFVFKPSTRSRAVDWYWEIWRELGGELSDFFEVQVPSLSTAVRLYLPKNDHMVETYQAFTKAKVVQMCLDSLEESVDLSDLQHQHDDKLQLELAWRGDGFALDWVSDTTTIDGKPRDWAVLAGLALIQVGFRKND
jgi:metal-responsive CopG/Arc/MetJ family transcriptional regulator